MNKQLIIILLLAISSIGASAQNVCKLKKPCNPALFIKEVSELRNAEKYDSIIAIINQKYLNDSTEIWPQYQLACFYSLKGDSIRSFDFLYKSIRLGADIDDILSDSDFEPLKNSEGWKILDDSLTQIYLSNHPNITNKKLSVRLWRLGIEDQKSRTLSSNVKNKNPFIDRKQLDKQYREETRQRADQIERLLKDKHWPTYNEIGEKASFAAMMIIQHSGNSKLTKKALPLIKVAVDSNQANAEYYAMLLDRYLVQKRRKQIYGTQIYRGCDKSGKCSDYKFEPIEDEKNVNQRRESIGLPSITAYAKSMGFEYVYHPEYEHLSWIKIRKLQKKAK